MRKIYCVAVLLFAFTLTAQNANRYYPSLKNLLSDTMDKQISNDFYFYDTWIRNVVQSVFYKDLQHSASRNGDASFDSMGLLFKRQNTFMLGNSGIELIINKDKPDFSVPVNIQIEQKHPILAYERSFDANSYDPKNFKQKYELGLTIFNLSEVQVLAEFLNGFVSTKKDKKITAVQQLILDLKKEAKIKITVDEKTEKSLLKTIANQVYQQSNKYVSTVLYDIYIKNKDTKKETQMFGNFFAKYNRNASEYIDEVVAYHANIAIPKTEISVMIPKEVLHVFTLDPNTNATVNAEKSLEVLPRLIEMKTIQTVKKKCVEFTLTLAKTTNPASFKVLQEIPLNKHAFLTNDKRSLTKYKVSDIQKLILSVSENEITVDMIVKMENGDWNVTIMRQDFKMN